MKSESIYYFNGANYDEFNLAHILAHYIENDIGSKSYQEFNILLNKSMTLKWCESLKDYKETISTHAYEYFDVDFLEFTICKNVISILEIVEIQLKEKIQKIESKINIFINNLLELYIGKDKELSSLIDINYIKDYVEKQINNDIMLQAKTIAELNNVDVFHKQRKFFHDLIIKHMIDFCSKEKQI